MDGSTVGASAGVAPTVALTPWKRRASGAANALEMAQVAKANTYLDILVSCKYEMRMKIHRTRPDSPEKIRSRGVVSVISLF